MNIEDIYIFDSQISQKNGVQFSNQIDKDVLKVHIAISLLPCQYLAKNISKQVFFNSESQIQKTFDIEEIGLKAPNLLETINHLIKKNKIENSNSLGNLNKSEFLLKVNQTIENNLSNNKFNIPFLCSELCMSRGQFSRKIMLLTGKNAVKYVNSFKLTLAMELILQGRHSLKEIAYRLGYSDNHYFSKAFKREFGYPPSFYLLKKSLYSP